MARTSQFERRATSGSEVRRGTPRRGGSITADARARSAVRRRLSDRTRSGAVASARTASTAASTAGHQPRRRVLDARPDLLAHADGDARASRSTKAAAGAAVLEVAVQRRPGTAGGPGDLGHADGGDATGGEQLGGRVEDVVGGEQLRAPRASDRSRSASRRRPPRRAHGPASAPEGERLVAADEVAGGEGAGLVRRRRSGGSGPAAPRATTRACRRAAAAPRQWWAP